MHAVRTALALMMVLHVVGHAAPTSAQTYANVGAVELDATVRASPPRITVRWHPLSGSTGFTVYRKLRTETAWGASIATLPGGATSYDDDGVTAGAHYEYRVDRAGSPGGAVASAAPGTGYIAAAIELAPMERPGAIVVVVDDTLATALVPGLTQLTADLEAEGWIVYRRDVSRTASVTSVRNTLELLRRDDPRLRAAFLVGHVPVPYAGNLAPDGHDDHRGAWPADSYYADLDGTYTDTTVNSAGASRTENRNVPGDGKFDQSSPPSSVELEVGRVDFSDMPAFARSETELVADYLARAHAFRTRAVVPMNRGLVWDNINWAGYPLAASAHRASAALVGIANTTRYSEFTTPNVYAGPFFDLVNGRSHLFAAHLAGGSYTGSGAGNTSDLADPIDNGAVFVMSLGSYFGDWDSTNNFLRAQIARGAGLVSVWSGLPNWWLHPLALGETAGACMRISLDNGPGGVYAPHHGGWDSRVPRGHLALHGDPALRMRYPGQATALTVSGAGTTAEFAWTAAPGMPDGYHLYERDATNGELRRLSTALIPGTRHTSTSITLVAGRTYAVRAATLETGATGTYWNLGLASFAVATSSTGPADGGVADMGAEGDAGVADLGTMSPDLGSADLGAGSSDLGGGADGPATDADREAGRDLRLANAGCACSVGPRRTGTARGLGLAFAFAAWLLQRARLTRRRRSARSAFRSLANDVADGS
jgi:hypothetical protein